MDALPCLTENSIAGAGHRLELSRIDLLLLRLPPKVCRVVSLLSVSGVCGSMALAAVVS